jgi:glucose/arabinose dehydrogenase
VRCLAVTIFLVALALATGCGGGPAAPGVGVALPRGFVDEPVAKLEQATVVAFLPDGRMLLGSKLGLVRMLDERGRVLRGTVVDLRSRVCTERERGLVGLAVDPDVARTRYVYVYYTFKKHGSCTATGPRGPVNRLARYALRRDGTLDPATETILLDDIPSVGATHNGGDLKFAKDGFLYVGVGDGGRDYARRTDTSQGNPAARDRNVLLGKILRLTRDGHPAPGNPYTGPGTVPCATVGVAASGMLCQETFAWGLRNPWRIALDPDAADVRFYINDVGQSAWEEIDVGRRGADYGWNLREGPCPRDVRVRCTPAKPSMTDPLFSYAHTGNCTSITSGAFVPRNAWPRQFAGAYLFVDFICDDIWLLRGDTPSTARRESFARGLSPGIVSTEFRGSDLYYVNFLSGELRRIRYDPAA